MESIVHTQHLSTLGIVPFYSAQSGFVESFNISVAAALVMYEARSSRERNLGFHGDLSPAEVSACMNTKS